MNRTYILMIKIDNIKSENGLAILSKIEKNLMELAELGEMEGQLVEK